MKKEEENKERFAMAIKHTSGEAPEVTAAGTGFIADKIIETAEKNDIPIRKEGEEQDIKVKFHGAIPIQVYDLVTEILSFVCKLEHSK